MSSLAPAEMRRLKSTFALFGSDKEGEVIAAISAAKRLLAKAGLGFGDLTIQQALPPPRPQPASDPWQPRQAPPRAELLKPHQRQARLLLVSGHLWNEWERKFLNSVAAWTSALTPKQAARLREMATEAGKTGRFKQGGGCDF
jgi:hypothetical protein